MTRDPVDQMVAALGWQIAAGLTTHNDAVERLTAVSPLDLSDASARLLAWREDAPDRADLTREVTT